jgi:hypothetical protein
MCVHVCVCLYVGVGVRERVKEREWTKEGSSAKKAFKNRVDCAAYRSGKWVKTASNLYSYRS